MYAEALYMLFQQAYRHHGVSGIVPVVAFTGSEGASGCVMAAWRGSGAGVARSPTEAGAVNNEKANDAAAKPYGWSAKKMGVSIFTESAKRKQCRPAS